MKHDCEIDTDSTAAAQFCSACGRRWLKLDSGTWQLENRADRRAGRRAYRLTNRSNVRRPQGYRVGKAAAQAKKSSWAAKRARPGWKAKMAAKAEAA